MSGKEELSGTNNSKYFDSRCKQCGGQMQATTGVDKHDKVLKCLYCGYIIDVPDDFYSQKVDSFNDANGKISKQKTTTIKYQVNDPNSGDTILNYAVFPNGKINVVSRIT